MEDYQYADDENWTAYNQASNWSNETLLVDNLLFYYYLWTVITPAVFGLIVLVGTIGNLLVIYVIVSKRGMQTVINLLLLNLAAADIAFLVICVPFTAYKYYADSWVIGDRFCKVTQYSLYVTAYVTVYTLVAISALRFLTIVCSNTSKSYCTRRNVILLIAFIWVVMLCLHVPTLLAHQRKTLYGYTYCGITAHAIGPMFVTFFVFAYALPLLIICVLYLLIVRFLQRSNRSMLAAHANARERTTRASRVILLVVVVFGLSWLPHHVNALVSYFGTLPSGEVYQVIRLLWNCMAYGNSCANPIIYNYVSHEFRKSFKEAVCCREKRCNGPSTTSEMVHMMPTDGGNTTSIPREVV